MNEEQNRWTICILSTIVWVDSYVYQHFFSILNSFIGDQVSTWLSSNLPFKKAFLIILGIICKNKSSNLWQIFTCDYWFCKFMSEWFFPNLIISVLSPGLQSSRSSHCIAGVKFIENNQSTTLFYFKTKHTFLQ